MKKALLILLVLSLAASTLTACSRNKGESDKSAESREKTVTASDVSEKDGESSSVKETDVGKEGEDVTADCTNESGNGKEFSETQDTLTQNNGSSTKDTSADEKKEEKKTLSDFSPFYGCWRMEELDVWYVIYEDGTYNFVALYDTGEFEQDGPYSFKITDNGLYLPEYLTELTYNDGKLIDIDGNIFIPDEIFDPIS